MKSYIFLAASVLCFTNIGKVQASPRPQKIAKPNNKSVAPVAKPKSLNELLVEAVNKNQQAAVQNLLNRGASPNARNEAGSPALLVAANRGYELIVRLLLAKGANPDLRGVEGSTALLEATVYERPRIMKMLLDKKANTELAYERGIMQGTTPLISAVSFEPNLQITKLLLVAGANVNAQTGDGDTALIMAADAGNLEVVRLLLLHGAKVDMRGFLGRTALLGAVGKGNVSMAKLLIASGADINARTDETLRLAWQAAFVGDKATFEKLAKSGALNKRHENGPSMLSIAKLQKNKPMIELLKQAGAKE